MVVTNVFPKKMVAYECRAVNLDFSVVPSYHCYANDHCNCSSVNFLLVVAYHSDPCSNFVSQAHIVPNT